MQAKWDSPAYTGADQAIQYAKAAAFTNWITSLGTNPTGGDSDYVAYERATAQAAAQNAADMAEADASYANQQATNNLAYANALAADQLAADLSEHTTAAQRTYAEGDVAGKIPVATKNRLPTRPVAWPTTGRSQHAIDLATAQKTYQVTMVSPLPPGEGQGVRDSQRKPALVAATATADTNHNIGGTITGQANADLAWKQAYAAADKQYALDDAGPAKTLAVNLATYHRRMTWARPRMRPTSTIHARALAGDGTNPGYWDRQTAAANVQAASNAARTTWRGASYAKSAAALATMSSGLASTPAADWAQYESDLAAAQQSWWGSVSAGQWNAYLANVAAVNNQYAQYKARSMRPIWPK